MSKKNLIERLKKLSNKQLEEILRNYNVNAIDTFLDVLVKELFDKFKIEKKEEIKDIEYDSRTGKVIKINNWKCDKRIFVIGWESNFLICISKISINKFINLGLAYISKETCEKAEQEMIKKVEEENKKIGVKC